MTAREIVAALEALGVRVRFAGGDAIDLEAESEPPRELLDELRRSKAAVLAFLRMSGRWTDEAKSRDFGEALGHGQREDDFTGPRSAWGTF